MNDRGGQGGVSKNGYVWRSLLLDEGVLVRAVAIMAIMAHNYLHWISDVPGENEFTFRAVRVMDFMHGIWNTPWDAGRLVATYIGHYGVQVFFFLSGYGLMVRYGSQWPSWWGFQKRRWRAFFPAVVVAAAGYLVYDGFRIGWYEVWFEQGENLLRQMIGVSNFIPENIYHPIGPWWFIGVILQFYLIMPLVFRAVHRFGDKAVFGIMALGLASEYAFGSLIDTWWGLNINHSILGHLDVCLLGVWFAFRGEIVISWRVMIVCGLLFVAGNFWYVFWVPSGLALMVLVLPGIRWICRQVGRLHAGKRAMMWIGHLSMYLFLCNGYLRRPVVEWAEEQCDWWTSLWTCAVFILLALAWAVMIRRLELMITCCVRRCHQAFIDKG